MLNDVNVKTDDFARRLCEFLASQPFNKFIDKMYIIQ